MRRNGRREFGKKKAFGHKDKPKGGQVGEHVCTTVADCARKKEVRCLPSTEAPGPKYCWRDNPVYLVNFNEPPSRCLISEELRSKVQPNNVVASLCLRIVAGKQIGLIHLMCICVKICN